MKHSFQINGLEKCHINSAGLQLVTININNHYIMTHNGGNLAALTGVNGCGICPGTGDIASYSNVNFGIMLWYGIGFIDTCNNTCKIVFNVRTGDVSHLGNFNSGNGFITNLTTTIA